MKQVRYGPITPGRAAHCFLGVNVFGCSFLPAWRPLPAPKCSPRWSRGFDIRIHLDQEHLTSIRLIGSERGIHWTREARTGQG